MSDDTRQRLLETYGARMNLTQVSHETGLAENTLRNRRSSGHDCVPMARDGNRLFAATVAVAAYLERFEDAATANG